MDQEFFKKFYTEQFEKNLISYNQRGNRFRYATRLQQVALLVSAAVTPVIVAASGPKHLKTLAIVLSSFVAILSGLGRIFKPEDAWMNVRTTRNALWHEATYYHAGLSDYASAPDKQLLFVERITAILDRYNTSQSERIQESLKEALPPVKKADVHGQDVP